MNLDPRRLTVTSIGSFTEIETIYRAYQVLLFNRLRT